jgi:hypothetical protein
MGKSLFETGDERSAVEGRSPPFVVSIRVSQDLLASPRFFSHDEARLRLRKVRLKPTAGDTDAEICDEQQSCA